MCSCCSRQVYDHCPRRSQEPSKGDRMEHCNIVSELLDQWYSTKPHQDPPQDSDRSCALPHRCNCDHAAFFPTISDKGSLQRWCLPLQHSHDLRMTFVGSQSASDPFVLRFVESKQVLYICNRQRGLARPWTQRSNSYHSRSSSLSCTIFMF